MPGPVGWQVYQNQDQYTQQEIQKIKQSYDSQLTPPEASWLMEQNKARKEYDRSIPKPTAMKPEPDQTLDELIEDLENQEDN